jgi:hypothetical protein
MKTKRSVLCGLSEGNNRWTRFGVIAWALLVGMCAPLARSALPDLKINASRLILTVKVVSRTFSDTDCELQDGCVRGTGVRKLLLFDFGIVNTGRGDLVIGDPLNWPDLYRYDECHGHYHAQGLMLFKLLRRNYLPAAKTHKPGFCFRDDKPYMGSTKPSHGYSCGDNQGISSGWQDIYDSDLPCQYIDVTGVPRGKYYLSVKINNTRVFAESNYLNNQVIIPVTIP